MNPFLNFIAMIGSAFMSVFRIPQPTAVLTEEQMLVPSEGRSFINFDQYDPGRIQRNRSESDLTEEPPVVS